MKKSGTIISWFIFGLVANFLIVVFSGKTQILLDEFFIAGMLFVFYRILMDWKLFDNPIEDELREIAISNRMTGSFLFASIASIILLFSNRFVFPMNMFLVFLLGIAVVMLTQLLFEDWRKSWNQFKQVHLTQKKIISLVEVGQKWENTME